MRGQGEVKNHQGKLKSPECTACTDAPALGLVSLPAKLKVPAMFMAVRLSVVIYTAPESAKLVDHVSPVADVNVACPVKLGPPSTTLPGPVAVNSNCILVPEPVEPLIVYVF